MSFHDSNNLGALAGEWLGAEEIADSRWGAGGPASARVSARLSADGTMLIHEYESERDGAPWLTAHAVFTYDPREQRYALFWFDSLGFRPAEPAPGAADGATLSFLRSSPRGQTRHHYTIVNPDCYELTLESSFDGGATWTRIMRGRYTRRG